MDTNSVRKIESAFSIWKSCFGIILLAFILSGALTFVGERLTYYVAPELKPPTVEEIKTLPEEEIQEEMANTSQEDFGTKIKSNMLNFSMILAPLGLMITGGLFVGVYKRVMEKKDLKVRDLFVFYKDHFLRNYAVCFIINFFSQLLLGLFIVPGVYFAVVFFFWPLLLYKDRSEEGFSLSQFFKDTLEESKGERGTIFAKLFKYGFIIFVIVFALMTFLLFNMVKGMEGGLEGTGAILTGAGLVSTLLIALLVYPVIYLAYVEIFLERKKVVVEREIIQDQLLANKDLEKKEDLDQESPKLEERPYDQDIHSDFDD